MACDILTGGVVKDCENNAGGLRKIWITDLDNITSYTEASDVITAITMVSSPATQFYELEFNRNTSGFTENQPINVENGSAYYEQIVDLVIPKRDATKRAAIKVLAQRDVVLIVLDANGIYWLVGKDNGALLTEHTGGAGLVKADGSKYVLKFTAEEFTMAQTIEEAAVLAVI